MITIIFGFDAGSAACVGFIDNATSAAARQSDSAKADTNDFIDLSFPKATCLNSQYLTCDLLSPHGVVLAMKAETVFC